MDEQNEIQWNIMLPFKKQSTDKCYNRNKPQKHHNKKKKPITDHKAYDFIYGKCPKQANLKSVQDRE